MIDFNAPPLCNVIEILLRDMNTGGNIDSRWLERVCGEAPFITNCYDAESGEIISVNFRAGVLDRKIRAAKNFSEAKHAVQSIYGYDIKSKFARALLGTLKVTQHNHKGTWINVPLQDFTAASDID